jgi:type IV pilus biogenesis protein CpaD/CtpE
MRLSRIALACAVIALSLVACGSRSKADVGSAADTMGTPAPLVSLGNAAP